MNLINNISMKISLQRYKPYYLFYILAGAMLFLAGCSSKSVIRKYYLLEINPQIVSQTEQKPLSPDLCEIVPADIAPAYAHQRIAVRQRSHEISYYQYHEWAIDPVDVFSGVMREHLQNQQLFEQVSDVVLRSIPRFQARTSVYQLEAVDRDGDLYAHLSVRFLLFDQALERPVVEHTFNRMEPLKERDLNLFAAFISLMLQEELTHFSDKIRRYLVSGN